MLEVAVGDLPPESWVRITEDGPLFASERWLKAVEGRAAGPPHFFMSDGEGGPVVGLGAMLARDPSFDAPVNIHELLTGTPPWTPLTDESWKERTRIRSTGPPAESWFPNLAVTLPSGVCLTVGPGAKSDEAVDELVGEIIEWARERSMAILGFLFVAPEEEVLSRVLSKRELIKARLSYDCQLELPGKMIEDYLAFLPGKRRNSVRREMRHVEEAGVIIRRRHLDECLEDLVELRLQLKRKYGRSPNEEKARGAFTGLIDNIPREEIYLFTAEAGGEMVSFSLFLAEGNRWHALMTGTEYDDPRWRFLYFELIYYSPIKAAYEAGARRLSFGAASWEAKLNRGCILVPLYGYFLPLRAELEHSVEHAAQATDLMFSDR